MRALTAVLGLVLLALPAAAGERIRVYSVAEGKYVMSEKIEKSAEEWRRQLTAEQFHVLREEGTERAYSGRYHDHHEEGVYRCAGCGLDVFLSKDKYDSKTGWPSYTAPAAAENIGTREDRRFFLRRTEVHCARCGGHLGHVFGDGPGPAGLRYCINSAALDFAPLR